MKIEILGSGCPKCKALYENVLQTLRRTGKEAEVTKVEDAAAIAEYGVMMTPTLVVDGRVRAAGRVLSTEEIEKIIG